MCRGESPQERVKPIGAGPSQMPEEGAGPLPSTPLPSPHEGTWGEIQAGEGAGPCSVGLVLGLKGYGGIGDQTKDKWGVRTQGPFARIHSFLIPN